MASVLLSDNAKEIVLSMKALIQAGSAERVHESQSGWQHPLLDQCRAMKADMESHGLKVNLELVSKR